MVASRPQNPRATSTRWSIIQETGSNLRRSGCADGASGISDGTQTSRRRAAESRQTNPEPTQDLEFCSENPALRDEQNEANEPTPELQVHSCFPESGCPGSRGPCLTGKILTMMKIARIGVTFALPPRVKRDIQRLPG